MEKMDMKREKKKDKDSVNNKGRKSVMSDNAKEISDLESKFEQAEMDDGERRGRCEELLSSTVFKCTDSRGDKVSECS